MNRWFYHVIKFGGPGLPAALAELGRGDHQRTMNNQTICRIGWAASVALLFYSAWHRGSLGLFHVILLLFLGVLGRALWGGPSEKLLKHLKQMSPQDRDNFLERLNGTQRELIRKKVESYDA